jgi:hypothetical protein
MTRTAIVTGASGGIGQGIAERLAKDGFSIVVHYAGNRAKAEETVKRIEVAGGKATAVGADISKATEVAQLFDKGRVGVWGNYGCRKQRGDHAARPNPEGRHRQFRQSYRHEPSRQLSRHERSREPRR